MRGVIEELAQVPGKNTVRVVVDEQTYEIARKVSEELQLHPGLELSAELLEIIAAAALRRAAAAQALDFLRRRPRTRFEVRECLLQKEFPERTVAMVLDELQRSGLVDDQGYAEWFVQARLAHRPTGAAKLVHEMRARGVPPRVAQAAVGAAFGELDEQTLAFEAARKRLPSIRGLPRERALRRLSQFLAGRGFSHETVRTVCFGLAARGQLGRGPAADESGLES